MTTIATGYQFSQYEDVDLPGELADLDPADMEGIPGLDDIMEQLLREQGTAEGGNELQ